MAISLEIDCYQDTVERRVVDLTRAGVSCLPVLGHTRFRRRWEDVEEHVHEGCLEISYCKSGQLAFESQGRIYPFLPGHVFVSRPDQPHRMKENPNVAGVRLRAPLLLQLQARDRAHAARMDEKFPGLGLTSFSLTTNLLAFQTGAQCGILAA